MSIIAQLLVRNLADDVKQKLRLRATQHGGRGPSHHTEVYGWASRLAAQFTESGFTESEAAAMELRGLAARSAEFE